MSTALARVRQTCVVTNVPIAKIEPSWSGTTKALAFLRYEGQHDWELAFAIYDHAVLIEAAYLWGAGARVTLTLGVPASGRRYLASIARGA